MKRIIQFLRTTLVGGLLFLVPIVVLVIVLGKALVLARKIVDPLAEHLPVHSIIGLQTPLFLAIGGIVLLCFLAGFFARTVLARKIVNRLEESVLSNVPGYEFLKRMSGSTLGVEQDGAYPVVLAHFDDASQIGFRIEVLENGFVVVFVPGVPNASAGDVYLMNPDRVTPLEVPPARALKCLKRLGAGSNALLRGFSIAAAPVNRPGTNDPIQPMNDGKHPLIHFKGARIVSA
ncbi:MAG: DUF502 domain-containing protein [Verrucomicrobiota bacterium]|jgi:uncharacterized membrane protein